jgi:predicted O-methyltransferase YrrM
MTLANKKRAALVSDLRDLAREVVGTPYSRAKVEGRTFLEAFEVGQLNAVVADFERRADLFAEVSATMARAHSDEGEQGGVSPDDGFVLYCLARWARPTRVIETGVAAGVSTSYLLAALADNGAGQMWSVELPPHELAGRSPDGSTYTWPSHGPGWAIPRSLLDEVESRWTLVLEDVRSALPRLLADLAPVDLFFHDDLHTAAHMAWEYNLVWPHLAPGGLLVSDDVNHAWIRFCRRHGLADRATPNAGRFAALRKPLETATV